MSSSVNLFAYLTNGVSSETHFNAPDDDGSDNDLSTETSPLAMTSSESSDSAIVSDEIDELDLTQLQSNDSQTSWPKKLDKSALSFASLSEPLYLFDQQNIYDNCSAISKYKRPLPRTTPASNYLLPNKVFFTRRHFSLPWLVDADGLSLVYLGLCNGRS